ncbi:Tn7 transposase TnsA N-terminal domain-containing protein [Bradyrhizobium sp. i1.12.3]
MDAGAVITAQPVTIRFEHEGRQRRYTPDFRVIWSDGRTDIVEIKYRADLRARWHRLRPAFAAARGWARSNGTRFRIATERGIRGPHLEAAKRLLPLRSAPVDAVLAEQAMRYARVRSINVGQLVDVLPAPREASRHACRPLSRFCTPLGSIACSLVCQTCPPRSATGCA